uniref:Galactose mutarotase n=1 Tax=Lygus hesperus TaxID=30085 RepID=A0A0K8SNM0_LYGHE
MADTRNKVVHLVRGNGSSCTVNLFGATITSWKVGSSEQLFVSKDAVFDGKTPIAGGIPVVFPKFSHWAAKPFHGFARECEWSVEIPATETEVGDVRAVLNLTDSDWTRQYWNYAFSITLEVVLGRTQLTTNISVHNPSSEESFAFELLLHTYLLLPDVNKM